MPTSKPPKKTAFSFQGFDAASYKQTEAYVQAIDMLYSQAIQDFAKLAGNISINNDKPFSFADYPAARAKAQSIIDGLASKMQSVIKQGSRDQWLYACKKNDAFLNHILNTSMVPKKLLAKLQDQNLSALDAFQNRKVKGLDLSQRVWNYSGQMKAQMELGIDIALGDGRSAQALSKDLRQYLVDPDKLFRRVRDKHGNLVLSKNAKAFHPGQGKYRSSYKNAMRLTSSEINMAYRESDQKRWQTLDFIVGFEVKLSNNHTLNGKPFEDICDRLVGKYPKNFIFNGWHPQCRCHAIPILQDRDEFNNDQLNSLRAAFKGTEYKKFASKNTVTDVPQGFKDWVAENTEASKNWTSPPYFIKDNFKGGSLAGGLKLAADPIKQIVKPEIKAPEPVIKKTSQIPEPLSETGDYTKGTNIKFKDEFFNLIDKDKKPIVLEISDKNKTDCYFNPSGNVVHIDGAARNKKSQWHKESVIYHEYGHAIDWQRKMRSSQEVNDLMNKHRSILKKKEKASFWGSEYNYATGKYVNKKQELNIAKIGVVSKRLDAIYRKVNMMRDETFTKRGITKHDVLEQIGAAQDTIMSLNPNYGCGHTKSYYKGFGAQQAEFIAHAFENTFAGNTVFKKYLPELYSDMVNYINSLK